MIKQTDYKGSLSARLPEITPARQENAEMHLPPALPQTSLTSWHVKMPPIFTSVPFSGRLGNADRNAIEATGRGLDRLRLADLQEHSALHSEVANLHLNDFFDDHGSFRFRRLGLTFAAKQRQRSNDTFGSSSQAPVSQKTRTTATSSAKAFFLAHSAIERDLEMCKKRSIELCASVKPSDRLRVDDVNKRRLEVVFNEIPACENYFPAGVVQSALLPVDIGWDVQLKELRSGERMAASLADKGWSIGGTMNWAFPRAEVLVLSQLAGLWVEAYRPGVPICGMDRATFCRLILDLGLVDQKKVPFFWAVALFDSVATPMRWCPSEASGASTSHPSVPCSNTVNSWLLISVLERIFRALFDFPQTGACQAPREVRRSFLLSIFEIAKYKLPAKVIEASGLKPDDIDRAIVYGNEIGCQNPRSGNSSPQGPYTSQMGSTDAGHSVPCSREAQADALGHPALIGYNLLRSNILQTMLVEPEVLHVVAQHQEIFERLHHCYADDDREIVGNMSFDAFRQFCVDFHISPALVSCHFLQSAYESSKCLEPAGLQNRNLSDEVKAKGRRILVRGLKSGGLAQCFESMEEQKKSPRTAKNPQPKRRQSVSKEMKDTKLRAIIGHMNPSERATSRDHRSMSKDSNAWSSQASQVSSPRHHKEARKLRPPSSTSLPRPVSRDKKPASSTTNDKVEGPEPWAKVYSSALQAKTRPWKSKEAFGVFGVSAFVETLCRIAFTYLSTYGNNSQVTASGYIRSVWFVTYLRCVFHHLQGRFQERCSGDSLHESLRRALQEIGLELWNSPPMAELALPPTQMHAVFPGNFVSDLQSLQKKQRALPEVPEVQEMPVVRRPSKRHSTRLSRAKLAAVQALTESEPPSLQEVPEDDKIPECVRNGICRICQSRPGSAVWGNPLCRGCSIVDRLSFKDHIFKRLLIAERTHYKLKARAEMPMYNAKRHVMTPPPMGIAHALRKAPELS